MVKPTKQFFAKSQSHAVKPIKKKKVLSPEPDLKVNLEKTVWTPAKGTRNRSLTMTMQNLGSRNINTAVLKQQYHAFLQNLK